MIQLYNFIIISLLELQDGRLIPFSKVFVYLEKWIEFLHLIFLHSLIFEILACHLLL